MENQGSAGAAKVALWTDPKELALHGRAEIVKQLRSKFASDHVSLAQVDTLDDPLDPLPGAWYRQGALLLDCAEALNVHVAVYEYRLLDLRSPRNSIGSGLTMSASRRVSWALASSQGVRPSSRNSGRT